ncbi:NmrA/HSCARG family protein [Streptomyces sp. NPDC101181]|uniref:NmrA/HSCARG family protein n=1 Tax=Streptomyces sp. NPDC101181 TaxID=3366125 RepID=UPI0038133B2E
MTIAVLGATGGQGGAVLAALRSAGQPVRAVVRDPRTARAQALAASGIELAQADLTDPDALARAFDGASAAFAVTTPFGEGMDAEKQQGIAIVDAAGRASLPFLVMASVASADRNTGIPHFETKAHIEKALAESGLPATVVAPTYFYENALGSREIARGEMSMALPSDVPLQQVSRANVGQVVAAVLAEPARWLGARLEVAGDAPTPAEMARSIGRASGRHIAYREIPLASVELASPDMAAMFAYLTEVGYAVDAAATRADFPEVPWTSFTDWAAGQNWSMRG